MTPQQAYDWLAPKLTTEERKVLDVISIAAGLPAHAARNSDDSVVLSGLTPAQCAFMTDVRDSRAEVAEYLRRGVSVAVVHQTDVPESPPFALDVVEKPGFWMGCFSTPDEARAVAVTIGLQLA